MYHKVTIVGHLGRDPEMRYSPTGRPVTNFSMASTRKWTNQDGSPGEETVWIRVSVWGKQAEICNQYLSKGRLVLVEGILRPDQSTGGPRIWTRQDGTAGASYEVMANTVRFLGGRGEQVDYGPPAVDSEEPAGLMEAEDIPF